MGNMQLHYQVASLLNSFCVQSSKAAQNYAAALNRSIFAQSNQPEDLMRHRRVVDQLAKL
jgi:hypothetical protein